MNKYYGASAPSDYTVKYWFREFRGGRNSTADEVRSGRPSDAVTQDNVKKINEMVLADRKVKVRELADATRVSTERTCHILGEILQMRKITLPLGAAHADSGPKTRTRAHFGRVFGHGNAESGGRGVDW